jgi:hypothetical protein
MKQGDLIKYTFAKQSKIFNKEKKWSYGILLESVLSPPNSWIVLLQDGQKTHADITELELIRACR